VILGCVAWKQLIKPRMEARRTSRYQVHGRRSKRLRNPKPRVKLWHIKDHYIRT
jgi:hypothetical protein